MLALYVALGRRCPVGGLLVKDPLVGLPQDGSYPMVVLSEAPDGFREAWGSRWSVFTVGGPGPVGVGHVMSTGSWGHAYEVAQVAVDLMGGSLVELAGP